jgi:hypothetical protein
MKFSIKEYKKRAEGRVKAPKASTAKVEKKKDEGNFKAVLERLTREMQEKTAARNKHDLSAARNNWSMASRNDYESSSEMKDSIQREEEEKVRSQQDKSHSPVPPPPIAEDGCRTESWMEVEVPSYQLNFGILPSKKISAKLARGKKTPQLTDILKRPKRPKTSRRAQAAASRFLKSLTAEKPKEPFPFLKAALNSESFRQAQPHQAYQPHPPPQPHQPHQHYQWFSGLVPASQQQEEKIKDPPSKGESKGESKGKFTMTLRKTHRKPLKYVN